MVADIDGTTNLDAVDIDGAVQADGTITVGVDDTGYDVKFFGATASAYMLWDESADDLILAGAARVVVPASGLVIASTAVSSTAAELNLLDGLDRGSILYGNASSATTVLGQGSADQVLTSDGTDISWEDAAGGVSGLTGLVENNSIWLGDDPSGTTDTASYNVALGTTAMDAITTGDNNAAIGYGALGANTTGAQNVAVGSGALDANTTAVNNTGLGYLALSGNTTGSQNIAVGSETLQVNTTGAENIAIGVGALESNTTASYNVAVGRSVLAANTTGASNTAVGYLALDANTTASNNTAVGSGAFGAATTGGQNTAVGHNAGLAMTTGTNNVCIGDTAGDGLTTGGYNTCVGDGAGGALTTASGSTCIGRNTNTSGNTAEETVIGYNNSGYAAGWFTVLDPDGKSYINPGGTSWSGTSDSGYKENIETSTAGLSFINDLRPVTFTYRKKKDIETDLQGYTNDPVNGEKYYKGDSSVNHGFIAQEVKTVLDNHSEVKDGSGIWQPKSIAGDGQSLAEGELIPMLVKAVQELSDEIDKLKS